MLRTQSRIYLEALQRVWGGTMALPFSLADVGSALSWANLSGKVCREAECMAKLGAVCVPGLSLMPFLLSSKLLLALKNMLW